MNIKRLYVAEYKEAIKLSLNVFTECGTADFNAEGLETFKSFIHNSDLMNELTIFGAFEMERLIGIIGTKNQGQHISIFFIDPLFHRKGIGKTLFETAYKNSSVNQITVNSSSYAVKFYESLGFLKTSEKQETNGLLYTPMALTHHIYSYRNVSESDLGIISNFPQNAEELFFMFPKAEYPFTLSQLKTAVGNRFDSTVALRDEEVVGFANFYEIKENQHCSIGNVIVNPKFRNQGIGEFLIKTMENIGIEKYNISEMHLSCFNTNTNGILLYSKLGYKPYAVEKWIDKENKPIALIELKREV